jgi:uncharacterized protein
MEFFSQPWPWYVAGPLIGLVAPLLLLLGNKPFGISSNLRHICAAAIPDNIDFFKYYWKKYSWNLTFAAGIVFGGFIGNFLLGNPADVNISSETFTDLHVEGISSFHDLLPADIFSWKSLLTVRGFIFIILGGFLVGFGTRYAGGCTSGHAILGLSNLQWPSLIATISFFVGGLIMTHIFIPHLLAL